MFCPTCGTRCPDNAIACTSCGSVLPGLTTSMRAAVNEESPNPALFDTDDQHEQTVVIGNGRTASDVPDQPSGHRVRVNHLPSKRPTDTPVGNIRLGVVKLVVEQGRILGEQFLLNDYDLIIGRYDAGSGRCPDIDLTAQDPAYVHRQHVRLAFNRTGDQLMVYDMGGRNGSYLNNQLIEKNGSALIQMGDKLRVGRVVLRVQAAREVEDDRHR